MTPAKIITPMVIAALLLPAPLASSDFSQLGEPAFARSLMISAERQLELQCAALAYLPYRKVEVLDVLEDAEGEAFEPIEEPSSTPPLDEKSGPPKSGHQPPLKNEPFVVPPPVVIEAPRSNIAYEKLLNKNEAEQLKAAVLGRMVSDIGDAEMAEEDFYRRMWGFEVPEWDSSADYAAERAAARDAYKQRCQPIFAAARTNQLETALTPPSAAPIALMDVDTCLAFDLIAKASPDYRQYSILSDDRDEELYTMLVGPKGQNRKAREQKIASLAVSMGKVDPKLALTKAIPCLATYMTEIRKKPEFGAALEPSE